MGYNPVLWLFFDQIIIDLTRGAPLGWVLVLLACPTLSWTLPYFLALQDMKGSSCVFFLDEPLNQPLFQGSLIPLIGKWYIETKFWVLGGTNWYNIVIVPRLFQQTELGNIYTNTFIFWYLSEYIWVHEFRLLIPIQHISSF